MRDEEGPDSCNNERGTDKPGVGGVKEKESTGLGDLLHLGLVAQESREETRAI